jgi:hypothetical protein
MDRIDLPDNSGLIAGRKDGCLIDLPENPGLIAGRKDG